MYIVSTYLSEINIQKYNASYKSIEVETEQQQKRKVAFGSP